MIAQIRASNEASNLRIKGSPATKNSEETTVTESDILGVYMRQDLKVENLEVKASRARASKRDSYALNSPAFAARFGNVSFYFILSEKSGCPARHV